MLRDIAKFFGMFMVFWFGFSMAFHIIAEDQHDG